MITLLSVVRFSKFEILNRSTQKVTNNYQSVKIFKTVCDRRSRGRVFIPYCQHHFSWRNVCLRKVLTESAPHRPFRVKNVWTLQLYVLNILRWWVHVGLILELRNFLVTSKCAYHEMFYNLHYFLSLGPCPQIPKSN